MYESVGKKDGDRGQSTWTEITAVAFTLHRVNKINILPAK